MEVWCSVSLAAVSYRCRLDRRWYMSIKAQQAAKWDGAGRLGWVQQRSQYCKYVS